MNDGNEDALAKYYLVEGYELLSLLNAAKEVEMLIDVGADMTDKAKVMYEEAGKWCLKSVPVYYETYK